MCLGCAGGMPSCPYKPRLLLGPSRLHRRWKCGELSATLSDRVQSTHPGHLAQVQQRRRMAVWPHVFPAFTLVLVHDHLEQRSRADQQVSWLELALDFHASTHCALLRPEQDPATQTAFTMALFFEGASKRLGKICQQTVYPGEAVEHVNALTALGFGRASGLTKRPCLHQPEYVHKVLGEIALTRAKGALKFRQLKIDLPRHPSSSMRPFNVEGSQANKLHPQLTRHKKPAEN